MRRHIQGATSFERFRCVLASLALGAAAACGALAPETDEDGGGGESTATDAGAATTTTASGSGSDTGSSSGTGGKAALDSRCTGMASGAEISSYEDFVAHVASLTKVVTTVDAPCLIASLPRPLRVNATLSDLSVQPANGRDNPRIFVVVGKADVLVLGFGVSGTSAEIIELSVLASAESANSVKGEIALPLAGPLTASAPFDKVSSQAVSGSTCGACHGAEASTESRFGDKARLSAGLKPMAHQSVTVEALEALRENSCKGESKTVRCLTLEALFSGGHPEAYEFPAAMRTIF